MTEPQKMTFNELKKELVDNLSLFDSNALRVDKVGLIIDLKKCIEVGIKTVDNVELIKRASNRQCKLVKDRFILILEAMRRGGDDMEGLGYKKRFK